MVPMAVAIIGGVVSTFLTLYVVPCAYLVFSKYEKKSSQMTDENFRNYEKEVEQTK